MKNTKYGRWLKSERYKGKIIYFFQHRDDKRLDYYIGQTKVMSPYSTNYSYKIYAIEAAKMEIDGDIR